MRITLTSRHRTSHGLHLLMTLFTCGSWLPVWVAMVLFNLLRPSKRSHVDVAPTGAPMTEAEAAAAKDRKAAVKAESKAGRKKYRQEQSEKHDEKISAGWIGKLERHNEATKNGTNNSFATRRSRKADEMNRQRRDMKAGN